MVINIKNELNNKELEDIPEVKKYFSRIYTILSKKARSQLNELNISKEKMKKLKAELAFLPKSRQIKYINELIKQYGLKLEEN
ncbi:MAG: hypothetical protein ACFFHD_16610 [Promethearchaeota archaeon]